MKYCDKCGSQLNEVDKFCTGCGNKIEVSTPVKVESKIEPKAKGGNIFSTLLSILSLLLYFGFEIGSDVCLAMSSIHTNDPTLNGLYTRIAIVLWLFKFSGLILAIITKLIWKKSKFPLVDIIIFIIVSAIKMVLFGIYAIIIVLGIIITLSMLFQNGG